MLAGAIGRSTALELAFEDSPSYDLKLMCRTDFAL